MQQSISKHKKPSSTKLKLTLPNLSLKYNTTSLNFGSSIINNIIYNDKSHIVALFKDYLILDDTSEFLKRFYTRAESAIRLPRFFEYYDMYSKIYPNYTAFFEGKFIYRNIQRKQRMIDLQEQIEMEAQRNKKGNKNKKGISSDKSDEVFITDVYDSIINDRNNEDIEMLFNIKVDKCNNEDDNVFKNEMEKIIKQIELHEGDDMNERIYVSKGEKTLIDKIEKNIIKKKAKAKTNNNSMNSSTINNNKSHSGYMYGYGYSYGYSYNYAHNSKSKISDLKLMYQKNIRNGYLRSNENNNNISNNSKINIHISYRGSNNNHNNSSLVSNENISLPKSPHTDRIVNNNNSTKTFHKKTNSNSIIVNTNNTNNIKHDKPTNLKQTPTPNNVIYIINQNPKFTTHVNVYNNNNNNQNNNHNVYTNKTTLPKHNHPSSSSTRQISASSSIKRLINSSKHKYQYHKSSSSKSKHSTINSTITINKRNVFNNSNTFINNSNHYNNNMLKTAREIGYKELNILKSISNRGSGLHSRRISTKQKSNKDEKCYSRNVSSTCNKSKKSENICYCNKPDSSRNKRNISHDVNNKNSVSVKNNVISKNDSLRKICYGEGIGGKKKIMRGIHIKNFSKIFNVNLSQLRGKTERIVKKK